MREKRWLLLALYGILLAHAVSAALKARPKFKIATTSTTTTSTTTEEARPEESDSSGTETATLAAETNATTGHTLTGIPQIDYIWDPNLPRELNGYNLSDYPFYNSIPEDIDFKCDGLHDGFYASVPHKCQVYHHCLFGTRYDFLCANFTAFDQKTFICHFVSEVDCANSKKYWHRNDALYQVTTTTTTSTTTAAPVTVPTSRAVVRDRIPPRRRPPARRRPYDYYEEDYYDDEYGRPSRDFTGRDDYEYDDRKYRRDRDREFRDRDRDRDFRDRDPTRNRDGPGRDDRDRDNARDRYPVRGNRREPTRTRDQLEDNPRPRGRNPDPTVRSASREMDDPDAYDRRTESRNRDTDERRYYDKRFRDDYEDKEPPASSQTSNAEGLVKPAAPSSSVYARPRAPPKIRRPVPLSEQDRYAYKTTPVQPTEEPRRRPVDPTDHDYYEDELEDVRPIRRPYQRRPAYRDRDRDRDFYETRERNRPLRTRYEEARPLRVHQDRPRDRYYERERMRDRGKDRNAERLAERDRGRSQDSERPYSPRLLDRDRDTERPRSSSRSKDPLDNAEAPRRPSLYDRASEKTTSTTTTTTTTTCLPEQLPHRYEGEGEETVTDRTEKSTYPERAVRPVQIPTGRTTFDLHQDYQRNLSDKYARTQEADYQDRDTDGRNEQAHHQPASDEYSSEYYDEPLEDPSSSSSSSSPPPPRTAVRIVKRPFLPSRGGNPNPRGLSAVGSKAPPWIRDKEDEQRNYYARQQPLEDKGDHSARQSHAKSDSGKLAYDAYKAVHVDLSSKQRQSSDYDTAISRPALRRPAEKSNEEEEEEAAARAPPAGLSNSSRGYPVEGQSDDLRDPHRHRGDNLTVKWTGDRSNDKHANDGGGGGGGAGQISSPIRSKLRLPSVETTNVYSSTYKSEDEAQDPPSGPAASYRVKQRINEVTHRLQDIPESEYDVTLNDALTPTLIQEANLPSGFVLPLHRQQLGRDTVLQPSENTYKLSRPIHQQQKPFVPSPQFLPAAVSNNERGRTVYYRTPDAIQVGGAQYRQQRPSTWQDYTAY